MSLMSRETRARGEGAKEQLFFSPRFHLVRRSRGNLGGKIDRCLIPGIFALELAGTRMDGSSFLKNMFIIS